MPEKHHLRCSFRTQLHKLFAPMRPSLPTGAAHTILIAAQTALGSGTNVRSPTLHHSNLKSGGRLMDTPAEFRKYAANCKKMSKVSGDPEVKAFWHRMEERWLLCAKLAEEDEQSTAQLHARRTASKRNTDGVAARRLDQ
jgi:hypothetical protein